MTRSRGPADDPQEPRPEKSEAMDGKISRRSALRGAGMVAAGVVTAGAVPGVARASVARTAVPTALGTGSHPWYGPWRPPYRVTSAYARLGEFDDQAWQQTGWENLTAWPGDGNTSLASITGSCAGVGCWTTSSANDYIYFQVATGFKPSTPGGTAQVKVVYYDHQPGWFTVDYGNANAAYGRAEVVKLHGGNVWRTHTFTLSDVYFDNQQTGHADFRISVTDAVLGRSSGNVSISDVAVTFANFYPYQHVSVLSPRPGKSVGGTVIVDAYAPGMASIWARAQHQPDATHNGLYDDWFQHAVPDPATGHFQLSFPANDFPQGPFTIMIDAWGGPNTDQFYLQLNNHSGVSYNEGIPASDPPAAAGMRPVYADDFHHPLSVSYTGAGATYAAIKPDARFPDNMGQFGEGIFADPAGPYNAYSIVNNQYLRIRSTRVPVGYVDPEPLDRRHFGGIISSLRADGTGVAVQYGYFEARMLCPGGPGTWPAFWLLPQTPIATPKPDASTIEIDVTETFGDSVTKTRSSYYLWNANPQIYGSVDVTFPSDNPTMTGWHIYGVKIEPDTTTYYLDNVEIYSHATASEGGGPMFFMVDLAVGAPSLPVNLTTKYHDQVDLYVDYVRVYVSTGIRR